MHACMCLLLVIFSLLLYFLSFFYLKSNFGIDINCEGKLCSLAYWNYQFLSFVLLIPQESS